MDVGPTAPKRERWISNIKFWLVAGGGLFGDGYLNSTIGLVVPMIGYIYFKEQHGSVPAVKGDEIKGSFSIGMIVGQLLFGTLGDALGRHRVYGKECLFAIFGTLLVVLLPWRGLSETGVVAWLAIFRLITGIGTGGDYPMTSTLSAEHTVVGTRGRLIVSVFFALTLGSLTAAIVFAVLLAAFKSSIYDNINHLEWVWRLLLGFGIIPATLTLYARLKMKETKPYEQYVATETSLMGSGTRNYGTQIKDFKEYFSQWKHAKVLIATCLCWFLFDIAIYGLALNQSIVLKDIGYGSGSDPYDTLWKVAIGNIIVQFAGNLPGVALGIFLPDLIGRRTLQFGSCAILCVLYAIWAGVSNTASSGGLITLYTISQLVLAAGPNVTTFLIPVELFPTRVRGTAHGISAACGKCGAVLTAYGFGSLVSSVGLRGALGLFSGIMALISLITLLIPEANGKTLQEIEDDVLYNSDTKSSDTSNTAASIGSEAGSPKVHGDDKGGDVHVTNVTSGDHHV